MADLRPRDIIAVIVLVLLIVAIAASVLHAHNNPNDLNDRATWHAISGR